MQTLQAVIMGAVQGITEFLPVSSSGHIVLTSAIYKFFTGVPLDVVQDEEIFFDILIHLSTLFAVVIYFFKDLKDIFIGFFKGLITKNYQDKNFKLGIYILFSTFITSVIGLLIKDFAHILTETPFIVSFLILTTGIVLLVSEKLKGCEKEIDFKTSLIVGLFQGLAIFPGLSRSGMTISSALLCGIKREEAAKYSFILSVPVILLASLIYPLISFKMSDFSGLNFKGMFLGMITSFVIGYICIEYFMSFVKKNNLKPFAFYCIIIGLISAFLFLR